jgi:hypothetical protein
VSHVTKYKDTLGNVASFSVVVLILCGPGSGKKKSMMLWLFRPCLRQFRFLTRGPPNFRLKRKDAKRKQKKEGISKKGAFCFESKNSKHKSEKIEAKLCGKKRKTCLVPQKHAKLKQSNMRFALFRFDAKI